VARSFSSPLDDAPALVESQREKLLETERAHRKLAAEVAQMRGRELYSNTALGPDGIRRVERRVPTLSDELRAEAQSFVTGAKAVFLVVGEEPPAILLAASADSGVHAGNLLKNVLASVSGRGGGSATMAQGSVPDKNALESAVLALRVG
jgi:alanyl-tRNA synthetase